MVVETRSTGARLFAVGAVFVVLGTVQLLWSGSDPFALGLITGGAAVASVGIYLLMRGTRRSREQ